MLPSPPSNHFVSDQLDQLRRQRAAIQQHLDWLDGEIARAEGQSRAGGASAGPRKALAVPTVGAPAAGPVDSAAAMDGADAVLESYRREAAQSPAEVKRGCWTVFAGALGLLGLVVVAWYFLRAH